MHANAWLPYIRVEIESGNQKFSFIIFVCSFSSVCPYKDYGFKCFLKLNHFFFRHGANTPIKLSHSHLYSMSLDREGVLLVVVIFNILVCQYTINDNIIYLLYM